MIKKKISICFLFYLFCSLSGILFAQEDQIVTCKISYISNENIYVDKGRKSGLNVGDTLKVKRDSEIIANLHILYVAEHSASCAILTRKENLHVGDEAELLLKSIKGKESEIEVIPEKRPDVSGYNKKVSTKPFARISGGISLQWYHYEDHSGNELNFDQPTVRLNLRAKELWGEKYYFVAKLRFRKNQRSRNYSTGIQEKEWRNRIYSFYFSYEDINSPVNYRIGRILTPNLRGVGYLDGIQLQHNITEKLNWGIYAGLQSEWQFAGSEDSLQKYGVFINYQNGDYKSNRFAGTIAFNGVYHGKTISRENIYIQSSFRSYNSIFIHHSMEVDVNRSWRRDKANQSISLTSFYLSARYKFSKMVMSGISYDNRKNYYRYETRDLPEDLYDLAFRHGLTADLSLTLPKNYYTSLQFGVKKRQHDSEITYIGRITLRKKDILIKNMNMSINLRGYTNYYSQGWIPSIYLYKQIPGGHYMSLTSGLNNYKIKFDRQDRSHYWLRFNGHLQMIGKTYLSGYYTYEWGDDLKGHKVLAEFGYRF